MTQSSGQSPELDARLERIESLLAHVQHDIEGLNASLLVHFRRLQEFETRFQRIEHEIIAVNETVERRDPKLEKPPHY